ncbi:hypothetical protein AB3N04_00905 (plasmid) [Alkalihalophilus sp. As8PL]|uniref:Uncharacterized protein n=1 Tax=Alkalihalophilus sp. As8PL TaxID=3237103 RepID=A0AB39BN01_9BACI
MFNVEEHNQNVGQTVSSNDGTFISSAANDILMLFPTVVKTGFDIISLLFVLAVMALPYAIMTKNAQWLKFSTGTMIMSGLVIVLLRFGFLFVSTNTGQEWVAMIRDILTLVSSIAFYSAIGMLLIAFYVRVFHKAFQHQDYLRWSRRLYFSAAIVFVLSLILPTITLMV